MVEINVTELEVYSNTIAVAYAARANARISEGFEFHVGKIMLFVKELANTSDTVGELSRKVLAEALLIANGDKSL